MSTLGERVQQIREERGLNVTETARLLNVSNGRLALLESGEIQALPWVSLVRFSIAFNVSLDWLAFGDEGRAAAMKGGEEE